MKLKYALAVIAFIPCLTSATPVKPVSNLGVKEVFMFNVKNDLSSQQVIKIADRITPILSSYPGFIFRILSQEVNHPHTWIDATSWMSLKDAQLAAKKIINNPQMHNFVSIMQSHHIYYFDVKAVSSGIKSKMIVPSSTVAKTD
jgi:hypothetical protein